MSIIYRKYFPEHYLYGEYFTSTNEFKYEYDTGTFDYHINIYPRDVISYLETILEQYRFIENEMYLVCPTYDLRFHPLLNYLKTLSTDYNVIKDTLVEIVYFLRRFNVDILGFMKRLTDTRSLRVVNGIDELQTQDGITNFVHNVFQLQESNRSTITYPDYQTSITGGVKSSDTTTEYTAQRELFEELGIKVPRNMLHKLGTRGHIDVFECNVSNYDSTYNTSSKTISNGRRIKKVSVIMFGRLQDIIPLFNRSLYRPQHNQYKDQHEFFEHMNLSSVSIIPFSRVRKDIEKYRTRNRDWRNVR